MNEVDLVRLFYILGMMGPCMVCLRKRKDTQLWELYICIIVHIDMTNQIMMDTFFNFQIKLP